jgi:uncharacterized membrane protein
MELSASVHIRRPAAEVFAYIADPGNNPAWQKGMRSCEWITTGPVAVGSQYCQVASFLGRAVVSVFEVVDYTAGETIAFHTIESTFPIQVRRSVAETGNGTSTVSAVIGGGPRVPRILEGIVGRMAQRSVGKDYSRLVARLEA